MSFRRQSPSLLWSAAKFLWPAVALGILAVALGRGLRSPAPLPRLPVRRTPRLPSSSRQRRLSAPPAEVALPETFWDAAEAEDDPAEVPHSSPLVSQASQAAAGVGPGDFYDASLQLRW